MASYYNPSKRLSEWAAAALSPFIQLETQDGQTDQSRLSVGLWSGHVQLKNVELRPEAFEKFLNSNDTDFNDFGVKIRWKIVRGTIDDVSIGIPWKRLLVGSSYSSVRRGKQKQVNEGQSELHQSIQRQDSDLVEMGSGAGQQEKEPISHQPLEVDDGAPSGCTTIKINGVCLILGYEAIHQDSRDHSQNNSSFNGNDFSEDDSNKERLKEERNRILQVAERRLLAGLDPFPPSLTESLQKDIQSILQSSLEESLPEPYSDGSSSSTSTPATYRSKVENYLSSTIKSLLWRAYDSLSVSVSHVKISVVGDSHYDKKIKVLSKRRRVKKTPTQKPVARPGITTRNPRPPFHHTNRNSFDSRLHTSGPRCIASDIWDPNWDGEPYPATITPIKRGRTRKEERKEKLLTIHQCEDENDSHYSSDDPDNDAAADEEDVAIWSKEGHVEVGIVLDKIEMRPGILFHQPPKQELDGKEHKGDNDGGPMSVKHLNFRRIGVFVRRGQFYSLTAKKEVVPKPKKTTKDMKPWHELDNDDFIILPTNIQTECTFYRNAIDGDIATVTSTHTTKVKDPVEAAQRESPDRSHATAETKRRAKRDKSQPKSSNSSTMQTIESNFVESHLMPKQLELNWTVGHIRSSVSSRHFYLINSFSQSMSRLKRLRPSTTIRSSKAYDRTLIERMAEEGQPVVTALDAHMYRILPQLRSTKYSRRTLLTLPRVVLAWWKYAITSVMLELNQRQQLLDKCTNSSESKNYSINLTTVQKLRWNWKEQSRIRREYIELYLLVNGSSDSNEKTKQSTKASLLSAESRLEEIENSLSVERIMLLRNVSRAASLSADSKDSDATDNPAVSFYNFTPTVGQVEDVHCTIIGDDGSSQTNKIGFVSKVNPSLKQSDSTVDASPKKCKQHIDKAHVDPLLFCSSLTIAGFSLALCELHHQPIVDHDDSQSDTKSDEISALTGFSDSGGSSSLHQTSEQQTVYEKFDVTYRFWENSKLKLRLEPISLLHISDVSLSIQHSPCKQKYRLLVGGIIIKTDILSPSTIFSIGSVPGVETIDKFTFPVNIPCISTLTICGGNSPASTYFNLKASSINFDLEWLQRISSYLSVNKDLDCKSNLSHLYKESSLRRVAFNLTPTHIISTSSECERIQIKVPLSPKIQGQQESTPTYIAFTLNKLRLRAGAQNLQENMIPNEDGNGYELDVDALSVRIKSHPTHAADNNSELFQIPIAINVRSSGAAGCQPVVVHISPVHVLVSEIKVRSLLEMTKQYSRLYGGASVEGEFFKPQLPAISEYTLIDVHISIESIGLDIFTRVDEDKNQVPTNTLSLQQHLQDITSKFLSLVSCLDAQYPNQYAIDCMTKLCEDKYIALGLSQNSARQCIENALCCYQSEIRSKVGNSSSKKLSHDEIDQIISQAIQESVLSTSTTVGRWPDAGLYIRSEAVSISLTSFYYKSMAQVKANCFKLNDAMGTNLLHIAESEIISPSDDSMALAVSITSHHLHPDAIDQDIYFELNSAYMTFQPDAYLAAFTLYQRFSCVAFENEDKSTETSGIQQQMNRQINFAANGELSSVSVIIAEDFIPFVSFNSSGLSFNYSSIPEKTVSFVAKEVSLHNVSPTGAGSFPDVLTTHRFDNGDICTEHHALSVCITKEKGVIISDVNDISICLDGVKVTVLRQLINEILQYTSSSKYGLGLMLKSNELDLPANNSSQISQRISVKFTDSTIILPRDSNSIDLVGIEVKELVVSPMLVQKSWSLDSFSFEHVSDMSNGEFHLESTKSSISELFYDCVEDQRTHIAAQEPQITRIAVCLRGARLFTALNAHQHSPEKVNISFWNKLFDRTGRCEHNKQVYEQRIDSINPFSGETKARIWEEVTTEPLSLSIKADFAPTLRLLIEMAKGNSFLDMRMSQLYLIMSIWFSNMQELPFLFPYDNEVIVDSSMPPETPLNWPEYGSNEFVKQLNLALAEATFEMSLCMSNLRLTCSYDPPGYFSNDPMTQSMMNGQEAVSLSLECAICNIISDENNVLRVGLGATAMSISDERARTPYEQNTSVRNANVVSSLVDLNWGLNCGRHTLIDGLPLPFQVTVFMTPDNHCMINVGADRLEGTMQDLTPIWILLDFFGLYFKDSTYGHPSFAADQIAQEVLNCGQLDQDCLNIDFRLWLIAPNLIVPSSSVTRDAVCVMVEATTGIHYRYKSQGPAYSSQEIVAKDLGVVVLREYAGSPVSRGRRQVSGCLQSSGAQTLIDDLSFSIQYDFNENANYTKFAVCVPLSVEHLDHRNMNGIEAQIIDVRPYQCQAPICCKPFFLPSRDMNSKFTIYLSIEYMKLAAEILTAFVGPKLTEDTPELDTADKPNMYSVTVNMQGAELIISDPVMGMHRPLLSISLSSLFLTASHLQDKNLHCGCTISSDDDLQVSLETIAFIDYFKLGKTRNWEPLVEPFKCLILHEKSRVRGEGLTINFDSPLHLNITSAAIDTFDDAHETFELFWSSDQNVNHSRESVSDSTVLECLSSNDTTLIHSQAEQIDESERRAFALKNNTGQQIRVHTLYGTPKSRTTIYYLDPRQTMPLSFPATLTKVWNFETVEVRVQDRSNSLTADRDTLSHHHTIDIQVPGFRWLHGVSIEETGRKFISLTHRSPQIQSKISADWRLANCVQLLADVQSLNGGRRLSLHSPFEIINKTDHTISLSIGPDPRHCPQSDAYDGQSTKAEYVNPDESYIIPHLLLEKALQIKGSHLGSVWIKPKPDSSVNAQLNEKGYPTRPIQLAKIVHETSVIWSNAKADPSIANQFASGAEISCQVLDTHSNQNPAPFCYVVEVKRSPLASQKTEEADPISRELFSPSNITKGLTSTKSKPILDNADTKFRHLPVMYSLHVHPPIVIENLLPECGRFELMHATNKTVLWWGILEPGQKIPVHSVGLDTPLQLLVNLGFCRTPVGEGALVHNGRDGEGLFKAGWNSIGHAMRTSKNRVKKTLYSVTESKDNRGAERVGALKRGMYKSNDNNTTRIGQLGFSNENESIDNTNGSMWYGESVDAEAIDSEMTIIDSIGQRLTLLIDNVIGGGGQRFISLFCPYWIVNTTNHSLRYKQEKVSGFVSGTVLSSEADGSKRVDFSNRNKEDAHVDDLSRHDYNQGQYSTIFSGRPGALSRPDGNTLEPAALASLISEDLPLSTMSRLAFMFNFQDVLSLGSPPRLQVQLAESQYSSAWSSGFGLESVGVTQIVGMHCRDGRRLEVSISVGIAPGRLSDYTKIVRICPRYVIVNQLSRPIRIWQDNSILHPNQPVDQSLKVNQSQKWTLSHSNNNASRFDEYKQLFGEKLVIHVGSASMSDTTACGDACYVATIYPSEVISFHLPDTRIDRLLRIEYGSSWNLSPSIPADVTGEYHFSITRAMDLRLLNHVSSRAAPVYTVTIPSPDREWDGELGAWFESEWGRERTLIVKGVKKGSFASYWTDITVGDQLISIDDIPVEEFTFEQAMKLLKARLSSTVDRSEAVTQFNRAFQQRRKTKRSLDSIDCVRLTFMTLEERMRNLRRIAVMGVPRRSSKENRHNVIGKEKSEIDPQQAKDTQMASCRQLLVDTKFLFQSIFMFVHEEPNDMNSPYIIRNRSLKWAIFYRQRNCEGHPWTCLYPGESSGYTWQEPTKPKKLSVRVGTCEWIFASKSEDAKETKRHRFSLHFIKDEEQGFYGPTKTIKLEEIGHMDSLPCPVRSQSEKVYCMIDTEGTTRALIISDEIKGSYEEDEVLIKRHLTNIRKEIAAESSRKAQLVALNDIFTPQEVVDTVTLNSQNADIYSAHTVNLIESELQQLIDFGEGTYIERRNQVLEATGLVSADLNGLSNPYVKVSIRDQTSAFKSVESRSTYFVEKSLSPKWSQQIFVFDVPAKAASNPKETRNFSIQCTIKSHEKFGKDPSLGQVQIQLRDLMNQNETVGWYRLMGVLGQRDVDMVDRIRGSVKIRVQYVSDYQGLISYYKLCSERRMDTLKNTKSGMQRQLRALRETAKQEAKTRESLSLSGVPALTMIGKKNKRATTVQKQKLESFRDSEKPVQSSRISIIQGVRDGTETTLKKSIGIAKSVVRRGKRRSSKTIDGAIGDDDSSASHLSESPDVFDEDYDKVYDNYDAHDQHSTTSIQNVSSSKIESVGKIIHPLGLEDFTVENMCRLSSLRNRCNGRPLSVVPSNTPFLSWNASRAFMQALNKVTSGSDTRSQTTKINDDKKVDLIESLMLPHSAPSFVREREQNYTEALMSSRCSFSKKASRSLSNVLNPGGVLTIRPITALNLSDDYTGMFIKLRYDNLILVSETVDCRVAPIWTRDDDSNIRQSLSQFQQRKSKRLHLQRKSKSDTGPNELADLTEIINPLARWGRPRKNDLQIEVAPFETSKSLRLSVIGERIQSNVELGILDIELGPALECCTQSLDEFDEDRASVAPKGLPPAYIRWFPLTPPSDAIPVEGDMGQSARPKESEKVKDDMFSEYFAPCIKLALMFKPHSDDADEEYQSTSKRSISDRSTDKYLYAKFDRLSTALIDSNRVSIGELLSFTSRDADLRLSMTKAKTRVSLAVGNVQVDQQRMGQDTKAPVILAPTPVKHPQPLLQFLVWKDNTRSKKDLDSFEYVALELQDLDLRIDESWLFDLWEFYVAIAKSREKKGSTTHPRKNAQSQFSSGGEEETSALMKISRNFLDNSGAISISKKVYIKELILGYMKISLWYYKRNAWSPIIEEELVDSAPYELFLSPKLLSQRLSDKGSSDEAFKQWSEHTVFGDNTDGVSSSTINVVSAIIPSISDASISFQGKLIEHVFETQGDIWKSLRSHYSSEALKQIYKIVGSLDFVGNPSMLLTSFRTGLRDFILQPSRELKHITRNPSRVGVGVLKGTVSLFSNSASGIFGFFSNLGSTAGQTATMFTFDEHFQRHHSEKQTAQNRHYDRWKRKGCGHVTLMITRPIHDIVFSIVSASTGIITEPYRGAKRNGVFGFGQGVGVGVLGLVVKPVVGLCDAFSHVMGSIDDIAKSVNLLDFKFKPIERYRLPYTFGAGKMLLPFNQVRSKSAQLLLAFPLDKKSRKNMDEVIVSSQALHMGPGWDQYVVVTTRRVVFFNLRDIDGTGFITVNLDWQVRFEKGFRVTSSLSTKGHNREALCISKISTFSERNIEEVSLSSEDTGYDLGASMDLERSHSIPETPKAFRLRNARLFTSAESDKTQRFAIEGNFGHRKQLINVHNAISCMSGNFNNLICEGWHNIENEGLTTFGNLAFGDNETRLEVNDTGLLFSLLERAPWQHLQDTGVWPADDFRGVVTIPESHLDDESETDFTSFKQELEVATLGSINTSELKSHFTFEECSLDDTQPVFVSSTQGDEGKSETLLPDLEPESASIVGLPPNHRTSPNLLDAGSPLHHDTMQQSSDAYTIDSRLQRVEELLEHLVYNQSTMKESDIIETTEQDEPLHKEDVGQGSTDHFKSTQTSKEEQNVNSVENAEIVALRNEISELKQQISVQAEANLQLQAQINPEKKPRGVRKMFRRKQMP